MANNANKLLKHVEYKLLSVEKTDPPPGVEDGSWYRYVVGRGDSSLEGKRRGTLKQVSEHAETLAADLNSRRGIKVMQYGRQGDRTK
jgi:hypothetical protein